MGGRNHVGDRPGDAAQRRPDMGARAGGRASCDRGRGPLALLMLGWDSGLRRQPRRCACRDSRRPFVVWSHRCARLIDEHRPDSLTVEFGIEITARTGALLSVLAEAGGTAQVKVTASWDRRDAARLRLARKEEPE